MRPANIRSLPAVLTLLVVVVVAWATSATVVYAHATLISASPGNNETVRRPPVRVVLHFSEAIEPKLTRIEVRDKNQERVDSGDTAFDDKDPTLASVGVKPLPPGLYFVKWDNVSKIDGHNVSGTYPFIVLNEDGSYPEGVTLDSASATSSGGQLLPAKVDAALKWLALLSLAIVAGAAFIMFAGFRPAAAFLDDEPYNEFTDAIENWVVWLAHMLIPLSFVASAVLVLLTVHRFQTSTGLVEYLTSVQTGKYRLAGMALLVVALVGANVLLLARRPRVRDAGLLVTMLASVGVMVTYSMVSHGAVNPGKVWGIASDLAHLAASAAWLGALVMLVPLLRWTRRRLGERDRFLLLAGAFDRFSIVAGLSVLIVLATGTFNGLSEIPNRDAMIDTTYGKILLAKIALVIPLLCVAGVNAVIVKPKLVAATRDAFGADDDRPGGEARPHLERLRRWFAILVPLEIALVVAVFASVGVLTQAATAKSEVGAQKAAEEASTKFSESADVGGLTMQLEVTPNRVGIDQFDVSLKNADGTPATTVTQARLRFDYDQIPGSLPQSEIILRKRADGEYREIGSYLTAQGNWRITLDVRRTDADDVSHQFITAAAPAIATSSGKKGAFDLPFVAFTWNEVAGAFAALAGVAVVIYRRQLRWLGRAGYRSAMTSAAALLIVGGVLGFGVHSHSPSPNPTAGNPIAPSQESVAQGSALFQKNCAICHGADGRGDGPAAAQLDPKPADLRIHMPAHDDAQFFNFIANGYPQSAMTGYKGVISDTDIWNLINFLRASFSGGVSQ